MESDSHGEEEIWPRPTPLPGDPEETGDTIGLGILPGEQGVRATC